MLDLEEDTFQEVPNSDISIYQIKPTRPSFVEKIKQEKQDIKYQKIWVFCHSIIFILIACETLYLLDKKVEILSNFYNTQEQCCYCAWIARNGIFNNKKEIEYSHCDQTYAKYNSAAICEINDTQYCQNNMLKRPVSTTSTFLFITFDKYYLYYGILGLLLVVLYSFFIIIATFKYLLRLSSLLFVGNIVIAIQLYYNYIKAYQYTKKNYSPNATCSNDALPQDSYQTLCYQNTVGQFTSQLLTIMVTFFMIYFIYPVVFYVVSCFIKQCSYQSYGYKCSVIQGYIERLLLYIGVVGGLISIVLCFTVLIIVIERTEEDGFIIDWFDQSLFEKYLCRIIGVTLFVSTLSVFCLPHCRSRCKLMIRARKIPNWKETIFDDEDEYDNFQQQDDKESVDLTEIPSKTMYSRPHSPLLK